MADWEAFCEFLSKRQPPRSLFESTAGDAMEFLLTLTSDRIMKVAGNLSTATFNGIDGDQKENPFGSPTVKTFLKELVKRQSFQKELYEHTRTQRQQEEYEPKVLLEKCLTTSDVGSLNRLVVTANKGAGKFVTLATVFHGTDSLLRLEDEEGKSWLFGFSYLNLSSHEAYEFTKGWSSYVKEKQLRAGDFVFFQRHRTDIRRLFISCRRRAKVGAAPGEWDHLRCPDPTSVVTSSETLEMREKLKEIETPLQLRLSEHSNTWFEPILIIYCGDNQEDSEETYFTSYIFNELCLRGFNPCRYDLTRRAVTGKSDILYKSRVCIMIISMSYSRSRESLDEFVAIMEHVKVNEIALLPVFFKVNLSDIMGNLSSFEKAFSRLGNSVQASQVLKLRATIIESTSINRYQYTKGDEIMLAKNIVRDICFLLNSDTNGNSQGARLQLKNILSLLYYSQSSAPQIVGLWGMAGIGKTTIAREMFRTEAERYDVSFFLPDFHRMCKTKGLSYLRDEFLSKIYGEEKVFIDACDTKLSFTRDRFLDKKVLIVLDDVSNARDVELMIGGFGWFSSGHTIILTSRNRQVLLQCKANELYEIPKLSESQSLHLCFQYATRKESVSLISEMVNYASGNPLAMRVLGSSVQNQCINDEKQHLRRLRQNPPIEIHDAFRRSYDGLHDNEKNILLDLACFFRGQNKDHVVNMLDSCGFFTDLGICALIDESLISLVENRLEMPNIFQDMGRFVVCQENNEAGKRSRLWDSNDISDVLINNAGTKAVEGIFLDASGLTCELKPTVFERMYRLRLLKLYCSTTENHCKLCLPQGLYSLPDELRLLHWERYPLGSLPRNFNPKNLVELNMPYSDMTKLWKGTKNLEKLKRIILSHSRLLTKFPRLSKARSLEHIDLEGCTSLVKVNSSILHHHKLTFLSLKDCSHLRVMPTTVHLESLEVLNLSGCSELEDLQDFSTNLKELYLAGSAIREMPSSTKDLTRLVTLDLENCTKLQHLPPEISNLKAVVKLSGCSNLMNLPILDALFPQRHNRKIIMKESRHSAIQESRDVLLAFGNLSSDRIPQENWPGVTITPLPFSIFLSLASRLYALVSLVLRNAYVVDIPEELCYLASLKALDLGGNSFSKIPESIKELCKLLSLRLRHCKNLSSLPELPRSLEILNAHVVGKHIRNALCSAEVVMATRHQQEHNNMPAFSICIPSSTVHVPPVNFDAGSSVMIELTPGFSSFSFLVVVEFSDSYQNVDGFGIKFICRRTQPELSLEKIFWFWAPKDAPTVRKEHMFVFGVANMHFTDGICPDLVAVFEFHPVNWQNKLLDDNCTVKRCEVYSLITPPKWDKTHSAKRPVMDLGELSSMEHTGPPYKRCRLKRAIESVILGLRKRKREMSVSRSTNINEVQRGSVSAWGNESSYRSFWGLPVGNVFPEKPDQPLCAYYMRTGDCKFRYTCKFHHPRDRETAPKLGVDNSDLMSTLPNKRAVIYEAQRRRILDAYKRMKNKRQSP